MLLVNALREERRKLIQKEIENELVCVYDNFETSVRVSFNEKQDSYFVWLTQNDKAVVWTISSWAASDEDFRQELFSYYYQQMINGLTP